MVCLTAIAVTVCIFKTNHLLLETIIICVAGLAGYKVKEKVDKSTFEELTKTIEDLQKSIG